MFTNLVSNKQVQRPWVAIGLSLLLVTLSPFVVGAKAIETQTLTGTVKQQQKEGTQPVEGAVVLVSGVSPKAAQVLNKDNPSFIDQVNQTFEPHLLPVQAGKPVTFKNSEMVSHNVRLVREEDQQQLKNTMTYAGQSTSYTFKKTGLVHVRCDIHPSMHALLLVQDDPFVWTQTTEDGSFQLKVPADLNGKVQITAWNDTEVLSQTTGGEGTNITLTFPSKKE